MLRSIVFQGYLCDDDEKRILNLNQSTVDKYSDSDIFFIILEIWELLRTDDEKYKNYKNYLNHPRVSYTKNMISTSMDN